MKRQKGKKEKRELIVELHDVSELSDIVKRNELVLIDFYTTWCPPCKMIAPIVETYAKKYRDVVFAKVNCEGSPDSPNAIMAKSQKIVAFPTFIAYSDGQEYDRIIGANRDGLLAMISNLQLGIPPPEKTEEEEESSCTIL